MQVQVNWKLHCLATNLSPLMLLVDQYGPWLKITDLSLAY